MPIWLAPDRDFVDGQVFSFRFFDIRISAKGMHEGSMARSRTTFISFTNCHEMMKAQMYILNLSTLAPAWGDVDGADD
jgi:hypothetical protein